MDNLYIERKPYFLTEQGIVVVEKNYNATYMGAWTVKDKSGNWTEQPLEVFYQPDPDTSKGHTNYFGMLFSDKELLIADAESAFSEPITGLVTKSGEVLVSRYRHDYQSDGEDMIDGGRDYLRCSSMSKIVMITVDKANFIISEVKKPE